MYVLFGLEFVEFVLFFKFLEMFIFKYSFIIYRIYLVGVYWVFVLYWVLGLVLDCCGELGRYVFCFFLVWLVKGILVM